jgi:hypothetical protein
MMKSLLRIFSRILNARHTNRLSVEMDAPAAFSETKKPDVLDAGNKAATRRYKRYVYRCPQDSFDIYWQALCRCCGVDYDEIPWAKLLLTAIVSRRATTVVL